MTTPETVDAGRASFPSGQRRHLGELVFAGFFAVLGLLAIVGAGRIRVPSSVNTIGPQVVPYVVGGFLLVMSVLLVVAILLGDHASAEEGEDVDTDARPDVVVVASIVAVALASGFLIPKIGWPLSAALLFAAVSLILKAPSIWWPAVIGLAVGLTTQYLFGYGLGVSLPAGWMSWLPGLG